MAAMPSPLELAAFRERLVHAAGSVLGAALAQHAAGIWDGSYASSRPFALIDFVNEVSLALSLQPKQRYDLRLALYKQLTAKKSDPSRAPLPARATVVPFPTATPPAPVAFAVFEEVCRHMYEAVVRSGAATPRQIADTLYRTLVVDYDKDTQADAFVRWTAGQNDLTSLAGATPDLYALYAGKFYAALRELLGPGLSDRLRSHALAAAAQLPAAAHYPPAQLLREA